MHNTFAVHSAHLPEKTTSDLAGVSTSMDQLRCLACHPSYGLLKWETQQALVSRKRLGKFCVYITRKSGFAAVANMTERV